MPHPLAAFILFHVRCANDYCEDGVTLSSRPLVSSVFVLELRILLR